jgi:hypothetical protein
VVHPVTVKLLVLLAVEPLYGISENVLTAAAQVLGLVITTALVVERPFRFVERVSNVSGSGIRPRSEIVRGKSPVLSEMPVLATPEMSDLTTYRGRPDGR